MLRRVAQVVRLGLFVVGFALVLWMPVSFTYHAWCALRYAEDIMGLISERGAVLFYVMGDFRGTGGASWGIEEGESFLFAESSPVWPWVAVDDEWMSATIPLWLLAAVCLAWPVTSFIVRRRRRGRGFKVESRSDSALSGPADISIVCAIRTDKARRTHSSLVHGSEAAKALVEFMRSKAIPARMARVGPQQWIIHFPNTRLGDDVNANHERFQAVLDAWDMESKLARQRTTDTA